MCRMAHVYFNKKLYSKKYVDEFFDSDEKIPDILAEVMFEYKDKYKLLP